jgi:hypothetical protein
MDIYDEMINFSRGIAASFPDPDFYKSCASEITDSHKIYQQNPLVKDCLKAVVSDFARNQGHGLEHAEKVAIEAGAMILAEGANMDLKGSDANEVAVLAQVAGILHDMRRRDKDHARSGAIAAGLLLEKFGLQEKERQYIVQAIANHEAFVEPAVIVSPTGKLLSDVLYDADKFRWGPDNFTVTLWEMLRFSHVPVAAIIPDFQEGMAGILSIKSTFRSCTGKNFGPEFIDIGLSIGNKIYEFLLKRFAGNPAYVKGSPSSNA